MKNINPSKPERVGPHEKLVKMVDSAIKSSDKVMLENQLSGMAYNLKSVSGEDWANIEALKELSYVTYGRPADEVNAEIMKKFTL